MTSTKSANREPLLERSGGEEIQLPKRGPETTLKLAADVHAELREAARARVLSGGGYDSETHQQLKRELRRAA